MIHWHIDTHFISPHDDIFLQKGIAFVSGVLRDLFQDEAMLKGEMCVLYNEPEAGFPSLILQKPLTIQLSINNQEDEALLLTQLSHELIHYVFYQRRMNEKKFGKRYEEIVAEALSLYILSLIPQYSQSFYSPFNELQIQRRYTDLLAFYSRNQHPIKEVVTPSRWKILEGNTTRLRERHFKEVLYLLEGLINKKVVPALLLDYHPYLQVNGSIDFQTWRQSQKDVTTDYLSYIQPIIRKKVSKT